MLFDLRSRGRRRTVQAVYLGLAIILGAGLVLFGVGAGSGFGGLLNAFKGGGSTAGQTAAVSQQEKAAINATKTNPNSAAAWAALVQARWSTARSSSADVNASTGYKTLARTPDPTIAILGARAYQYLGNYASATDAWNDIATANPNEATAFECLAANAYAANQTRKGDLASAKALSLVPKLKRTLLQSQLTQAKTNPQVAQGC